MNDRRNFLLGTAAAGVAAGAIVAGTKSAQAETAPQSTWERIHSTGVLRLGGAISEAWCTKDPLMSKDPGGVVIDGTMWRGLAPVMAQKLAENLGAKLQIVDVTWSNAIAALQADQIDVIFGFDGTPERAAAVSFIPEPFFWIGVALLGKPEIDTSTWEAVNDPKFRIGVPAGTSMETEIMKRAPKADLQRFPGYNEAIAAYQSGRVDLLTGSITTATLISGRLKGTVARMPTPRALFPISGGLRQETDPRLRDYMATAIGYYSHNGVVEQALNDMYAFRGVDITKVEPIVTR